jgi:hypothetical protein
MRKDSKSALVADKIAPFIRETQGEPHMKEQKVVVVMAEKGRPGAYEIQGVVPLGWRIVMISPMGGVGGVNALVNFAALVVIEKNE